MITVTKRKPLKKKKERIFIITGATLTWLALILQFALIIIDRSLSIAGTIIQFFSYFTILTNLLVALCYTNLIISEKDIFFTKPNTLSAITVYIAIVGLIYNLVLRQQWNPTGIRKLVDELLHSVNPLLFILYWILFVPKGGLQWKNIFSWLVYPAAYCIYVLTRGSITGLYPYPFMEVNNLGYNKVLLNCGLICLLFLVFSFLLVAIAKLMIKKKNS